MKRTTLIFSLILLTFLANVNIKPSSAEIKPINSESTVETIGDNSSNSLDWQGSYQGTLPCADCEGIETRITLNQDMTYLIQTKYLGKDEKTFEEKGTFTWNQTGNTVILSGNNDRPNQYFVGENVLIQLDLEGNRIDGDLAEKYFLYKMGNSTESQENLTGTYWKLVEIMGKPVENAIDERTTIHISLSSEGNKVQGFGGCNNFFGGYELKGGNRIVFSAIASTKKACFNGMETESELFKVLEQTDNYNIKGQVLMLNKGKMAPLAKFEAVHTN